MTPKRKPLDARTITCAISYLTHRRWSLVGDSWLGYGIALKHLRTLRKDTARKQERKR